MQPSPLLRLLYDVALDVAQREDAELHALTGTGVFFMPELAFAYAVGKEMAHRAKVIFPGETIDWQRETEVGGGGPTDLVFRVGEQRPLAVEFKTSATWPAYVADVAKLRRIHERKPGCYDLAFCAVVDANEAHGVGDPRVDRLAGSAEKGATVEGALGVRLERVGPLVTFPTQSPHYRSRLVAVVGVWHVIP